MIKLNASVSKKVPLPDVQYGSRSCSAGAEVEVSSGACAEELKEKFRALYLLLDQAVDEQLNGALQPATHKQLSQETRKSLAGRINGNGRKATAAQVKAIHAIAGDRGIAEEDLAELLQEEFSVGRPEELAIRDASALIDRLKNGKE